jgi:retron-type reverse transcriptase
VSRPQLKVKSFDISKRLVFEAWERVRANAGAPGVDAVTITEFTSKERANLYKLWLCRARDYAEWAVRVAASPCSGRRPLVMDSA